MNRKAVILIGLALILAAGGLTIASNMGFKFVKVYGNAAPGRNTISLPYFQSQFTKGSDLFNDITGAQLVCEYTGAPGAPSPTNCWTPGSFNNFTINTQNGYEITVGAATNQVIVGSHNPSLALSLAAAPTVNVKSLPYHMTYTKASDLCGDLGSNCIQVCAVLSPVGTNCWTAGSFNNFTLSIGAAYEIDVTSAASFVPDHY